MRLPLESTGTYNFFVDWGDSSSDTITSWDQSEVLHTYPAPGVYATNITGTIIGFNFQGQGDRGKIMDIQQWGSLQLGNTGGYFHGCIYLDISAVDELDLNGTTNFSPMFFGCT
ncbi:MAG: hypothetical protein JW776_09250 [Candidatus Lokiarchaeota archaeon]|nr:hypothetical protein [Candidatus Lokiarchaeota archaeon]